MEKTLMMKTAKRLVDIRAGIINARPFFGRLLMHLNFGFAPCSTACTDMKKIVFDPDFVERLSDDELEFVMTHELMHCVLKHCIRGQGKIDYIYNVACDIVVNSIILEAMGASEMLIDGCPLMHLAPNGKEGREYTAEQVYQMLMQKGEDGSGSPQDGAFSDNHDEWKNLPRDSVTEQIWNQNIVKAATACRIGTDGLSAGLQRIVDGAVRSRKLDWRQVLRDYFTFNNYDYTFMRPDRRYSGNISIPSYQKCLEGSLSGLWFVVDVSASIDDKIFSEAMFEIKDAIDQVGGINGNLSFFDVRISKPVPFESAEDIDKVKASGGGGTSFDVIFKELPRFFENELPKVIIILTDGYASFPDEKNALGVDVIWLIVGSDVTPPWGKTVRIDDPR